jgi:hypothetical protein
VSTAFFLSMAAAAPVTQPIVLTAIKEGASDTGKGR